MSIQDNPIYAITPFTTLDFPDKTACIAWFCGCNMRCLYCYNQAVVLGEGKVSKDEFLSFLNRRKNKLSGVVFSGGECTISKDFLPLAREVKKLGFLLKVDTNGLNLNALKEAVSENLIDYIALDFKADRAKFRGITGSNSYDEFIKTLKFLINIKFKFEVRTTVHSDLLCEDDISLMSQTLENLGYKGVYYLQNFLDTGENFGNLSEAKRKFDINKAKSNIKIKLRNFN